MISLTIKDGILNVCGLNFSGGDIAQLLLLLSTIVIILFSWLSIKLQIKRTSGTFIMGIVNSFYQDKNLAQLYYNILHGKWSFNINSLSINKESGIDHLLEFYNTIAHLLKDKLINKEIMLYFIYDIVKILENENVKKYITYVKNEFKYTFYGLEWIDKKKSNINSK